MSLGTFDRTPPPFFRQGPSALTKLAFFSALALHVAQPAGYLGITPHDVLLGHSSHPASDMSPWNVSQPSPPSAMPPMTSATDPRPR